MSGVLLDHRVDDFYLDSVMLMRIAAVLRERPGVEDAALMIGTASNLEILAKAGLRGEHAAAAGVSDLVVAVRACDEATARDALAAGLRALDGSADRAGGAASVRATSLGAAVSALAGANLALVSVPGEFASREARRALRRGLDVMIFSDNVPLAEEVALKQEARARGRLVMGPDCGTAWIAGCPLAFANEVGRGPVGIVSASGTGMQEVATLLDRSGHGLSHGIGVGGRDLNDAVGGVSTLAAIDLLAADPGTEIIVLLSKPCGEATRARVLAALAGSGKPAVACFLGSEATDAPAGVEVTVTLAEAAARVANGVAADADGATPDCLPGRDLIRGLFVGGTLGAEAQVVLTRAGLRCASNAPVPGASAARDGEPEGHLILDLGADEFTLGRPHPMIEPATRDLLFAQALASDSVAVVLIDVVLGHGAHPDPLAGLLATLAAASAPGPVVIASVVGTERDPQVRSRQVRRLEQAAVVVAPSNAAAAALAARVVTGA